jgi:hypothetical protein
VSQHCPKCSAQIIRTGPCPGCGAMVIRQGSWWDDPRTRRIGIAVFAAMLAAVFVVMVALLAATRPRRTPQRPAAVEGPR